jgi:hypothetical protein
MPRPILTKHVKVKLRQKRISPEAVELICAAYTNYEHDPDNDSYELYGLTERGPLCVAVTEESFNEPPMVVKTAYWRRWPG